MEISLKELPRIPLKVDNVRSKLRKLLPNGPGIYCFFQGTTPIYIGKANSLASRVHSYFGLNLETKTKAMIESSDALSYIKVNSEFEALLLEAFLIRKYQPQYNIISKDDKHPLYITITKEKFPRVLSARKLDAIRFPLNASFGPFPKSANVSAVLKKLRRIFPYSDHKLGKRACIYSHIGLCNPCPSEILKIKNSKLKISEERKYKQNVRRIKAVLSGRIDNVKNELSKEMISFSKLEKYEKALDVKKLIDKLEYITTQRVDTTDFLENPNLVDEIRDRELRELQSILTSHFPNLNSIQRIECFDIAHLSGTFPTASMVTFINAEADKTFYRHFKIKPKIGGDDYSSMKEVARRRMKHFNDWGFPGLIIVDGGLGQVKSFATVLRGMKANIPVVGIAKNPDRLIIDAQKIKLRGAVWQLVSRIRDEAHRFARRYHHNLLTRSLLAPKS